MHPHRECGMTKFSMEGSGALTVGGRSRPSSAIWNTSRTLDSALPHLRGHEEPFPAPTQLPKCEMPGWRPRHAGESLKGTGLVA